METLTRFEAFGLVFLQLLAVSESDEAFCYERDHRTYEYRIVKATD